VGKFQTISRNLLTITKVMTSYQLHSSTRYFTTSVGLVWQVFTLTSSLNSVFHNLRRTGLAGFHINFISRPNEQVVCFTAVLRKLKYQKAEPKFVEMLTENNGKFSTEIFNSVLHNLRRPIAG